MIYYMNNNEPYRKMIVSMATERSNDKYILNSVDNALALLNLFFDYEELSTNEIAKLLQISRSTAFRFVVTLEEKGFLTKTEHATYRLGMNMFSLLAFQSDQVVNGYIKKVEFKPLTPTSVRDAGELLRLLDDIRENGYAVDNEETEMGLTCYAVPILDASQRAIAAISISGPTTRM